jgi:hypothetical protein
MRIRIVQSLRFVAPGPAAVVFVVALLDLPLSYLSPHGYRYSSPGSLPEDPSAVIRGRTFLLTSDRGLLYLGWDATTAPAAKLTRSSQPTGRLWPADIPPYRFRRTLGFCLAWRATSTPYNGVSIALAFPHWFGVLIAAVPLLPSVLRYRRSRLVLRGGFPVQPPIAFTQPPPPDATAASPLG